MNAIRTIMPYKYFGQWVFDDESAGLFREAFVSGADTLMDIISKDIPDARNGFILLFSDRNFPGSQLEVEWRREELDGNIYYSKEHELEGWLCPALFKYFSSPPKNIYLQFKPKE